MKAAALLVMGVAAGVMALCAWGMAMITEDFRMACLALEKASDDFRDQQQAYYAERLRLGMALSQIERDLMRLRVAKGKEAGK
jgi:hypothetical protein